MTGSAGLRVSDNFGLSLGTSGLLASATLPTGSSIFASAEVPLGLSLGEPSELDLLELWFPFAWACTFEAVAYAVRIVYGVHRTCNA